MSFYLLLFISHAFCFVTRNKMLFVFSFLVLFVTMGYRGIEVGTDTVNYEVIFNYMGSYGDLDYLEPFFRFLILICKYFGGDYRDFLILSAVITLLPIYYIANDFLKNPVILIFLYIAFYYYLFSFNVLRQSMATSMCSLSIYLFVKYYSISKFTWKVKIGILLSFLIAVFIHYSCLIVLPSLILFFIIRRIKSNVLLVLVIFISILIGLFGYQLIFSISADLSQYDISYESNLLGTSLMCLLQAGIFCYFLWVLKEKDNLFYAYVIFLILFCLSIRLPYSNRAYFPIIIGNLMFFSKILEDNRIVKKDRFFVNLIIFVYLLLIYLRNLVPNIGEVMPYSIDF